MLRYNTSQNTKKYIYIIQIEINNIIVAAVAAVVVASKYDQSAVRFKTMKRKCMTV